MFYFLRFMVTNSAEVNKNIAKLKTNEHIILVHNFYRISTWKSCECVIVFQQRASSDCLWSKMFQGWVQEGRHKDAVTFYCSFMNDISGKHPSEEEEPRQRGGDRQMVTANTDLPDPSPAARSRSFLSLILTNHIQFRNSSIRMYLNMMHALGGIKPFL